MQRRYERGGRTVCGPCLCVCLSSLNFDATNAALLLDEHLLNFESGNVAPGKRSRARETGRPREPGCVEVRKELCSSLQEPRHRNLSSLSLVFHRWPNKVGQSLARSSGDYSRGCRPRLSGLACPSVRPSCSFFLYFEFSTLLCKGIAPLHKPTS